VIKLTYIAIVILMFTVSCSTIPINEGNACPAKRTSLPEDIRRLGYALNVHDLQVSDSVILKLWHMPARDNAPTLIYFGGNGFLLTTSKAILTDLHKQGAGILAFDYRGYGFSSGRPDVAGLRQDAISVYAYATTTLQIPSDQIILYGHSMGSVLALEVSATKKHRAIILESPLTSVDDLLSQLVPLLLSPFVNFEITQALAEIDNLGMVGQVESPLLIACGEADQITPPEMAEALFERASATDKKLIIVPEAGHNNLPENPLYQSELSTFFKRMQLPK
jgi:alpha-beta hydrolase superfamily lysophospholipase